MRKAIEHLTASDPVIGRLIEQIGSYRIEYLEPSFETLVKSIIYQQLSGKVALVIFRRVAEAAGGTVTPEAVLRMRLPRMRKLGLSQQKIAYIRDLARRARDGEIDFAGLPELSDQEVTQRLTRVKGIGVWTAHMFLIFALRRPDVLPVGDLGIRVAVRKAYGLEELPPPSEIARLGQRWRPYSTVASWYLWRSLESKAGL